MQTDLTPTQSILTQLTLPTNYIENKKISQIKGVSVYILHLPWRDCKKPGEAGELTTHRGDLLVEVPQLTPVYSCPYHEVGESKGHISQQSDKSFV